MQSRTLLATRVLRAPWLESTSTSTSSTCSSYEQYDGSLASCKLDGHCGSLMSFGFGFAYYMHCRLYLSKNGMQAKEIKEQDKNQYHSTVRVRVHCTPPFML